MIKPGHRTTEFLITVALLLADLTGALQGSLPPQWAAVAGAIATVGYAVSRALTKSAAQPGRADERA